MPERSHTASCGSGPSPALQGGHACEQRRGRAYVTSISSRKAACHAACNWRSPRAGVAPRGRRSFRRGEAQRVTARALGRADGTPRAAAAPHRGRPIGCAGLSWRALANDGRAPREPSDLFIKSGRWWHGGWYRRKPRRFWMARAVACRRAPFSLRGGYCPITGCSSKMAADPSPPLQTGALRDVQSLRALHGQGRRRAAIL